MITDALVTVGDLGKANSDSLKSAFGAHPDSILKDAPTAQFGDTEADILTATATDLSNATYATFYASDVMTGGNSKYVDHFGSAATMDYSAAPNQESLTKPDAGVPNPGLDGSTIAPSGLGPNVNVSDINGKKMVDAEPIPNTAFLGQTNARAKPSVTSPKIASGGVKGSTVKGTSAASVPEVT